MGTAPAGAPEGVLRNVAFSRLGPAPMALRIMLSMTLTVLAETLTASPLTACTVLRVLLVRSEVRKTRALGRGGIGGALGSLGNPEPPATGVLAPEW
jgi:hypothetical protein